MVWCILASVFMGADSAAMRKAFDLSSNVWLNVQWYLYGAAFLLAAGYVLQVNEHVRIDAVSHRFSARTRAWIDVVALAAFILPFCVLMLDLGGRYSARRTSRAKRRSTTAT